MSRIDELKKGCGEFLYEDDFEDKDDLFDHDVFCGTRLIRTNELILCPICQAKISERKLCDAEWNKKIENKLNLWYKEWKKDKIQEFWKKDFEELKNKILKEETEVKEWTT